LDIKAWYRPERARKLRAKDTSAFFMKALARLRMKTSEVARKHCPAKIFLTLLRCRNLLSSASKMTCAKNSSSFLTFLMGMDFFLLRN